MIEGPIFNMEVLRLLQGMPVAIARAMRDPGTGGRGMGRGFSRGITPPVSPPAPALAEEPAPVRKALGEQGLPAKKPRGEPRQDPFAVVPPKPLMNEEHAEVYGTARSVGFMAGGRFAEVFASIDRAMGMIQGVQRLMEAWEKIKPIANAGIAEQTQPEAKGQQKYGKTDPRVERPVEAKDQQIAEPFAPQPDEPGGTAQYQKMGPAPTVASKKTTRQTEPEVVKPVEKMAPGQQEPVKEEVQAEESGGTSQDQRASRDRQTRLGKNDRQEADVVKPAPPPARGGDAFGGSRRGQESELPILDRSGEQEKEAREQDILRSQSKTARDSVTRSRVAEPAQEPVQAPPIPAPPPTPVPEPVVAPPAPATPAAIAVPEAGKAPRKRRLSDTEVRAAFGDLSDMPEPVSFASRPESEVPSGKRDWFGKRIEEPSIAPPAPEPARSEEPAKRKARKKPKVHVPRYRYTVSPRKLPKGQTPWTGPGPILSRKEVRDAIPPPIARDGQIPPLVPLRRMKKVRQAQPIPAPAKVQSDASPLSTGPRVKTRRKRRELPAEPSAATGFAPRQASEGEGIGGGGGKDNPLLDVMERVLDELTALRREQGQGGDQQGQPKTEYFPRSAGQTVGGPGGWAPSPSPSFSQRSVTEGASKDMEYARELGNVLATVAKVAAL